LHKNIDNNYKVQMDKTKKVEAWELPHRQFEVLGLSRRDVLGLTPRDMEALLSYNRTSVLNFSIPDGERKKVEIQGRLSLRRREDGAIDLSLHPVRPELRNDVGLDEKEIEKLKAGGLVCKNINRERYLVQMDNEINEIVKVRTRDVHIPVDISSSNRERLLSGKEIQLTGGSGPYDFRLDLIDPKGYRTSFDRAERNIIPSPEWKKDLKKFNAIKTVDDDNLIQLIRKYALEPKITEAQVLIIEKNFAKKAVEESALMEELLKTNYAGEKGKKIFNWQPNDAEAKAMTQISNRDTDLKLPANSAEQESHRLRDLLFDEKKKINFDRFNPGIVTTIHTDQNRNEFMNYQKEKLSLNETNIEKKLTR
jgi:hypothetical protein